MKQLPSIKMRVKRRFQIGGVVLLAYLVSYLLLSVSGGYEPGKTGRYVKYGFLISHDIYLWQIRYGRDLPHIGYTTFLPAFYYPLLRADRKFWHTTLPMVRKNEAGEIVDCPRPPWNQFHPRVHATAPAMEQYNKRMNKARKTESKEDDEAANQELLDEIARIYRIKPRSPATDD